ncbi:MAG: deoxyribose-phosphate aldolase, partial [Clostridiales bacterium]|nr:deoxyribose-phosphate aldolase [Clostridiales bacterium]
YFDHTILSPDATEEMVEKVCKEALEYDFASVCVNQTHTKLVADLLGGSNVKVCTVIGFPLGAASTSVKVFETKEAVADGATEIDMVINIGAMKDKNHELVLNDIKKIKEACGSDIVLKVILETCLLTDEEKVKACELSVAAGADFVKTSTGFSKSGATAEDVRLMKNAVSGKAKVKASGGIRDYETAHKMIEAGADRLGTSATVSIVAEFGNK